MKVLARFGKCLDRSFLPVAESQRSINAVKLGNLEMADGDELSGKKCVDMKEEGPYSKRCSLVFRKKVYFDV